MGAVEVKDYIIQHYSLKQFSIASTLQNKQTKNQYKIKQDTVAFVITDRRLEHTDTKTNHYWINNAAYISKLQYSRECLSKYTR